jgi:glucose-6-phosphate 1-dehydrogenase
MTNAPDPCLLVIFGASGDLTQRKLIPAMFELSPWGAGGAKPDSPHGALPDRFAIVGVSRTPMSDEDFRAKMRESVREHATNWDEGRWAEFSKRVYYHAGDAASQDSYPALTARLNELAQKHQLLLGGAGGASGATGANANTLFYLSVSPNLYEPIIANIGAAGLVSEGKRWCSLTPHATPWQRIIVEKPFGSDLHSAHSLNMALGRVFEEDAIYRIDHYLGKELVQNIAVMRFANSIFEPMWNREYVDHVQVTAAETLGVGSRAANFYDSAGALRDMVQSHLLQVLAFVTIEPPSVFNADAIMREKIKLFNCARALTPEVAMKSASLGRYGPTAASANAPAEPAYVNEKGVDASRKTETYAAIRVEFDNWRWAGVPFYLRSGKKLARKLTEVVVQFRRPPTDMFAKAVGATRDLPGNRLVINIAPNEGIELQVQGKVPGSGLKIDSASLSLDYLERFGGEKIEAYGPLILDAMRGDRTLYKHRDEVEGAWRICQGLLDSRELRDGIETYAAGAWGPESADALLARDGRRWHNP